MSAPGEASWGTFSSSTMMVMMMASTPSLNASSRPFPMTSVAVVDDDGGQRLSGDRIDRHDHQGTAVVRAVGPVAEHGLAVEGERRRQDAGRAGLDAHLVHAGHPHHGRQ